MKSFDFSNGNYHAQRLREFIKKPCCCDCHKMAADSDFRFHVESLIEVCETYFQNFSPVIKDSLVRLKVNIDFEKAFGWAGFKDKLQPGAEGKVVDVSFDKKRGWNFSVRWNFQKRDDGPLANHDLSDVLILRR